MSKQVITNVTTYCTLNKSFWTMDCDIECDEVVVRQISFSAEDDAIKGIYVIESSLNSDAIIGSICIGECFSTNPNITIQLRQPLGGHISFQLLTADGKPARNACGDVSISLDFIKHKKWKE